MTTATITQRDIAAKLGISQDAVSTALRGDKGVSEDTRARVMRTAEQLGYRPNAAARAARTGRFDAAALLLQVHQTYLPTYLLHGVSRGLAEQGLNMVVTEMPDETMVSEGHIPKLLRELAVDGLLIDYIPPDDRKTQQLLRRHRIPAIWINDKRRSDCVFPDERDGGYRMTRHLIEAGHRRISFAKIRSRRSKDRARNHYAVADRQRGYERAMRQAGLSTNTVSVAAGARDGGAKDRRVAQFRAMWQSSDRPTALVCAGMAEAASAAAAALAAGLEPGRDAAIGCFHESLRLDVGLPVWVWQIPHEQVGYQAARMLLRKIADPQATLKPVAIAYTDLTQESPTLSTVNS
jgi:LacI family transcriptional regulator